MRIIVGLGNPGLKFKLTRHNMGFFVIDKLSKENSIRLRTREFNSLLGRGRIGEQEVIIVKPLTYMNLSGKAVSEIVAKEGMSLDRMMVICDDADLKLGTIRIRPKGSSGGHRGLASIIESLETEEFPRLRIGIGRKEKDNLAKYVLDTFGKKDLKNIDSVIDKAVQALNCWLNDSIQVAMNRFNT